MPDRCGLFRSGTGGQRDTVQRPLGRSFRVAKRRSIGSAELIVNEAYLPIFRTPLAVRVVGCSDVPVLPSSGIRA